MSTTVKELLPLVASPRAHTQGKTAVGSSRWALLLWPGLVLVVALAFVNLERFPLTWFDEGSHLHVPKTLVEHGRYADYSDGEFRYYGPTVGVGPTVMVPIAAAFEVGGVGLTQARTVMALYLIGAVVAFFFLGRQLGPPSLALLATLVLLGAPTVNLVEYGRQVLGEVPGLLFLTAGLAYWFRTWTTGPSMAQLVGVGVLFGLAACTKHIYLLMAAPALLAAAAANLVYYRQLPMRVFIVPGMTLGAMFGLWQVVLVAGLGPGTAAENLRLLQDATRGAAFVLSAESMRRAATELLSVKAAAGLLIPTLLYTGVRQLERTLEEQRWGVVWLMAAANLSWFTIASAAWPRYAFPGLTLTSLLVARFAVDAWRLGASSDAAASRRPAFATALGGAVLAWLVIASLAFVSWRVVSIVRPPSPAPQEMAAYLDANISRTAVIHSYEPEMGFLTDHRYRFPPPSTLIAAVASVWTGGAPVTDTYDFEADALPDYVLEGVFARWIRLYPAERLSARYEEVATIGGYRLYRRLAPPTSDGR